MIIIEGMTDSTFKKLEDSKISRRFTQMQTYEEGSDEHDTVTMYDVIIVPNRFSIYSVTPSIIRFTADDSVVYLHRDEFITMKIS